MRNNRRNSAAARRRHRSQEGNVAILVTLLLFVTCAFVSLSFDVGNVYRVRTESQAAVDSAALAAASGLDGTSAGMTAATARGLDYGNRHYSYTSNVALSGQDLAFGHWDHATRSFAVTAVPAEVNAVRATYVVPSVSMPFAAVVGYAETPVLAAAIAVGGGPWMPSCGFPLVVPDCALTNAALDSNCDFCFQLQSANTDNAAWTSFNQGNGAAQIAAAVRDACFDASGNVAVDATTGECIGACTNVPTSGTDINVNGGNLLNTGANSFCELMQEVLERNGAGTATPFSITAPVVETNVTGGACTAAGLNGQMTINGFTRIDIFGARCSNSDTPVIGTPPYSSTYPNCVPPNSASSDGPRGGPSASPPSNKYVLASLHRTASGQCDDTRVSLPGGSGFFGTVARPRLVQ
jgi:Flp pilus assembly protein TadG